MPAKISAQAVTYHWHAVDRDIPQLIDVAGAQKLRFIDKHARHAVEGR